MTPSSCPRRTCVLAEAGHYGSGCAYAYIVSRGAIDIPLGRIRSLGFLCEVGPQELNLDRTEAAELFFPARCAGVSLEPGELDRLLDDTRGWPGGIVIAANQYRRMSAGGVGHGRISDRLHTAFSSYFTEEGAGAAVA